VNLCERCTGSREAGGPCAVSKAQSPVPAWKTSNMSFFNTQVALRGQTVVQTYRKSHPWATDCYDTPVVDYRAFNVSGTSFGLFTCFDIAFKEPATGLLAAGIRAFSYSSAIPLIGRDAVKLFSDVHNATMVNANLQSGQTAVTKDGRVLADCGAFAGTCAAIATV
jgi:predicted amidohydrolase